MRPVNRLTKIAVLLVVLLMVVGSPALLLAQPAGAEKPARNGRGQGGGGGSQPTA